jgi:hypothetical protein
MPYPQGTFSGELDLSGGMGALLRFHVFDPGRHVDCIAIEELQGTVGGGNIVFRSSHVPIPAKRILFLRGQLRYEPADYLNTGHGKDWVMVRAPNSGDPQPFVVYFWDPSVDEIEIDAAAEDFFFDQEAFSAEAASVDEQTLAMPWLGI